MTVTVMTVLVSLLLVTSLLEKMLLLAKMLLALLPDCLGWVLLRLLHPVGEDGDAD
jgi:hypothetical protein